MELAAFHASRERRRRAAWIGGGVTACAVAVGVVLALQPARLPAGRLVVAMADLENLTGDATLDGFGVLFAAALEQSKRVALVDRATLVQALASDGVRPQGGIREADAVAAERAAAAQLVLVPSLRRAPGGFELAVQGVDLLRGRAIFGAREIAAAHDSLYAATDRLAARVREALAEDASEAPRRPVPVAAFAPTNPEALRLHVEAERLYSNGWLRDAKPKWDAALALDPNFPLPRLSLLQATLGSFPLHLPMDAAARREHARALRRDLPRLPEALRPWAETVIVRVEDGFANHSEYLAALDEAISARPEQPAPYFVALQELLLLRGEGERARPYLDRAVQLAPGWLSNLTDHLVLSDRLDDALALVRRWATETPGPLSLMNLCAVHVARGETEAALDAARRLSAGWGFVCIRGYVDAERFDELDAALARTPEQSPHVYPESDPVVVTALRGRVREALRLLRTAPRAPGLAEAAAGWPTYRAAVLLASGDPAAVEHAAGEGLALRGPSPFVAWMLAEAGNVRLARAMAGPAPDRLLGHRIARAIDEWRTGDPLVALAAFATVTTPASHYYAGQVLAGLGRHREAVEEFRRYRRLAVFGVGFNQWFLPRSLHLEALSLEALGERAAAREVNERLLRLWSDADPDLPLLVEAQALDRRLRGG